MHLFLSVALRGLFVGALVACACTAAMAQALKEPTRLILKIEAPATVNPDDSGRPSPIKVRLYELKDSQSFSQADFFSLQTADKTVLGPDLLAKDEFILRPGETHTIARHSNTQTTALGVLAGYQDMARSTWRVVRPLAEAPTAAWYRFMVPNNKLELTIQLQPQGIVLVTP